MTTKVTTRIEGGHEESLTWLDLVPGTWFAFVDNPAQLRFTVSAGELCPTAYVSTAGGREYVIKRGDPVIVFSHVEIIARRS